MVISLAGEEIRGGINIMQFNPFLMYFQFGLPLLIIGILLIALRVIAVKRYSGDNEKINLLNMYLPEGVSRVWLVDNNELKSKKYSYYPVLNERFTFLKKFAFKEINVYLFVS